MSAHTSGCYPTLRAAQIGPIHAFRPEHFAADGTPGLALDGDAEAFAEDLSDRDGFAEVVDRCPAPLGEGLSVLDVHRVQVGKELIHAPILLSSNDRSQHLLVIYPAVIENSGMKRSTEAVEDTENRRRQLQLWIEARHAGKQSAFVAAHKLNQGEISALLKDKSFGGVKARNLEAKCGMPPRYLDQREAEPAAVAKLSPRALTLARAYDAADAEAQRLALSIALQILRGNHPAAAPTKARPSEQPTPELARLR